MKIIKSDDKGIKYVYDKKNKLSFALFDLQRTKTRNEKYSDFISLLNKYFKNLYSECGKGFQTKDNTDRFFCCLIEKRDKKEMIIVFSFSISYENMGHEIKLVVNNTCKTSYIEFTLLFDFA